MTRYANQPKKECPLSCLVNGQDPLESHTETFKLSQPPSTSVCSSTSTSSTLTSCVTSTTTYSTSSTFSSISESCSASSSSSSAEISCTSTQQSSSEVTKPKTNHKVYSPASFLAPDRSRERDVISAVIPLPPPPHLGNACGGNQSYLGLKDSNLFGHERPSSPEMLEGSFGTNHHPTRPPGVVGLNNLGNTCFLNSGLQCLINTPPVVEFFLKSANICNNSPKTALTLNFQSVIRNAWCGTSPTLQPTEFKNVLGNIYSQFKDCRQHDCQEFLALTLDVLHEQLKLWNNTKKDSSSDTISSGFASGAILSTASTVNESDVSSSLQSPCSHVEKEPQNVEGSPNIKRRRLTDDSETACVSSVETEKKTKLPSSSPPKEEPIVEDGSGSAASGELEIINGISDEMESEPETFEGELNEEDSLKIRAREAEGFWMNYIRDNNTVIASSFQGMYKSTVTCSTCNYVSCTYEPFMYLSLPIPRTTERQYDVTFSSVKDPRVTKVQVTLRFTDSVGRLKDEVVKKCFREMQHGAPSNVFIVAEVANYHIVRMLDDSISLKDVYDGTRNIYVYEVNQEFDDASGNVTFGSAAEKESYMKLNSFNFQQQSGSLQASTYLDENWETDTVTAPSATVYGPSLQSFPSSGDSGFVDQPSECIELLSCSVCLEDMVKTELRQHYGCACILCSDCMTKTAACLNQSSESSIGLSENKPTSSKLKCPVCGEIVDYEKCFLPLVDNKDGTSRKLHLVPLLFRNDPDKDTNNNSAIVSRLIGVPWVVKLPSALPATEFYDFIKKINPLPENHFKVLNTAWDGKSCGHCMYTMSCRGCELPLDGFISINPRNSLVISYSDLSTEMVASIEPPDMAIHSGHIPSWDTKNLQNEPIIDIHECLHAFSEKEYLDDQNPWFCPACKKNQCATKSLTICRFPDYLIVYLKRFVFMDHSSNKLDNRLKFPINDFDVSEYIAEEFAGGQHVYDLYSCVCHFGTASSGHYTAFGKNPKDGSWHYFNDDSVSSKSPSEEQFSSAYVLFYAKKGLKSDIVIRRNTLLPPLRYSTSTTTIEQESSVNNDACDSTYILPDCPMEDGPTRSLDKTVGPHVLSDLTPVSYQESLISSTSSESAVEPPSSSPKSSGERVGMVVEQQYDKINSVREDVSNLHINGGESSLLRRKQPAMIKKDEERFSEDWEEDEFITPDSNFIKKPTSTYSAVDVDLRRRQKALKAQRPLKKKSNNRLL